MSASSSTISLMKFLANDSELVRMADRDRLLLLEQSPRVGEISDLRSYYVNAAFIGCIQLVQTDSGVRHPSGQKLEGTSRICCL